MKRILSLLAGMLMSICIVCPPVVAQTTAFTYQGALNTGGAPANGNFDFEFAIFDPGNVQIGSTITLTNIPVADGIFSVTLDFGDQFEGADRLLEIRVRPAGGGGAFTTLNPRQFITSAPYSIKSLNATTANNALQLGGITASGFIRNTTSQQSFSDLR